MSTKTRKILPVLEVIFLITSCSNPLIDRVNHAVEVAKGPKIALAIGSFALLPGGTKDFGQVVVGGTAPIIFTATNSGQSDLVLSGGGASVTISGTNRDQFSLSTPPTLTTISAGQSVTFALSFAPTSAGAMTASATVTSNDPTTGLFTFTVTGTGLYSGTVAKPEFVLSEGTYNTDISVEISCPTAGATIYYTIDHSDPSAASQVYSSPIAVAGDGAYKDIKAIGVREGMANSAVTEAEYWIGYGAAGVPTISSAVGGNGRVTITWVATTAATSYDLYWAPGTTVNKTGTKVPTTALSLIVNGLADGTEYAFVLTAVNNSGESAPSSIVTATTIPVAPTGLTVGSPTTTTLAVSWTASPGASNYQVYRDTSSGGSFATQVYNNAGTSFTDRNLSSGTMYYYKVQAADGGGSSELSSPVSGTTIPSTPGGLGVTSPTSSSLRVSWSSVTGATSYQVYRDISSTGSFTADAYNGTATSFIDSGLSSNTTYYYKVRATNASGSSTLSACASSLTTPAMPTGLTAAHGPVLSWNPSVGATSYTLLWYYQKDSNGWPKQVMTAYAGIATTYGDIALTAAIENVAAMGYGTVWFYVRATNSAGDSPPYTPSAIPAVSVAYVVP